MGSISRRFKEHLRVIKCHLKKKKALSPKEEEKAQYALEQMSRPMPKGTFNKTIWMFWDSGLDNAPEVVQLSYRTWAKLNPDYDVVFLDKQNIDSYLGFDFFAAFNLFSVDLGAAGKSDLLRLYLLNRFGGIWADATTFCKKPVNEWLDIEETGFFSFREKTADDRSLVSWFLASVPGHEIVQSLLNESLLYLSKERQFNLDIVGLKTTKLLASSMGVISQEGSGFKLLTALEVKYCAPYFWMFYLFNEVVNQGLNEKVWRDVKGMTNCHAELDDSFTTFAESYVAKQTYRDKYVSQPMYQQRVEYITNELVRYEQ